MAPIVSPPEIHHVGVSSHSTGDPFIGLMSAHFNNSYEATTRPPMGLTENQSPTFLSTGDPCLDFFHVLPDTPSETIHQLLKSAWDRDPLTTLKLHHGNNVRKTAKSERLRYKRRHPRRSNKTKRKKSPEAKSLGQKSIILSLLPLVTRRRWRGN